jgi:hypothetical protein
MEMVAAAATKDAKRNGGTPEWRVTVPEGASVTVEHERCLAARAWGWLVSCVVALGAKVSGSGKRLWKIGADDPRRAVHGLKVGLALSLVSVFYYTRPLYEGVGGNAMWAIMTVVVVFEYTVGESYTRSHVTSSNRNRMLLQLTYESAWVGFRSDANFHACTCRRLRVQGVQPRRRHGQRRRDRARRPLGRGPRRRRARAVHP